MATWDRLLDATSELLRTDLKALTCGPAGSRTALCGMDCTAAASEEACPLRIVSAMEPRVSVVAEKPPRGSAEVAAPLQGDAGEGAIVVDGVHGAEAYAATLRVKKNTTMSKLECDAMCGGGLRINRLPQRGILAEYNSRVAEERRIRAGDCIMTVAGALAEAKAFAAGGALKLGLLRPHRFVIGGLKKDGPLGLDVVFSQLSTALYVVGIGAGAVSAHNARRPAAALRPNDMIVAVNGFGGGAQDLHRRIGASDVLELVVDRICGEWTEAPCDVCAGARVVVAVEAPLGRAEP